MGSNVNYSNQISDALAQANLPKSGLAQGYSNIYGNSADSLFNALTNIQRLGNSFINTNQLSAVPASGQITPANQWGPYGWNGDFGNNKPVFPLAGPGTPQNPTGTTGGPPLNPVSTSNILPPGQQTYNPNSSIFMGDQNRPGAGYVSFNGQNMRIMGTTAAGLDANGNPKPVTANDKYYLEDANGNEIVGPNINVDDYNNWINSAHAPDSTAGAGGQTLQPTQNSSNVANPGMNQMLASASNMLPGVGGVGGGGPTLPGGGVGTQPVGPGTDTGGNGNLPVSGPTLNPVQAFNPGQNPTSGPGIGTGGPTDTSGNQIPTGNQSLGPSSGVNIGQNGLPYGVTIPGVAQTYGGDPLSAMSQLLSTLGNSNQTPGQIGQGGAQVGQAGGLSTGTNFSGAINSLLNQFQNVAQGGANSGVNTQTFQAISDALNQQLNKSIADTRQGAIASGQGDSTGETYAEGQLRAAAIPQLETSLANAANTSAGIQGQYGYSAPNINQLLSSLGNTQLGQAGLGSSNLFQGIGANQGQQGLAQGGYQNLNQLLSQIGQANTGATNQYNLAIGSQNQQAVQQSLNNQLNILSQLFGLGSGMASQGIPGGSANVNIGNPAGSGSGLGGELGGLGSLISALAGL